ncbi:MAG: mycothiol system anti-sigma-R factor [Actinomycetota bacterium]|nr:mycothiol system anti-sigma-R factor [Actinomycetota bacterium]
MSCGQPHDKDCAEVLENLFLFIDHEIEEASCAEIQQHLDECAPCLAKYQLEQLVKTLVARSCREPAPPSLRDRVLLQIRSVHVEITETRTDPGFGR